MQITITKATLILYFISFCFSKKAFSQPSEPIQQWEKSLATGLLQEPTQAGTIQVGGIVSDGAGNCYMTGRFYNTIDFDPDSTRQYMMTSTGAGGNIFILKLDSAGSLVWAKQIGNDKPSSIRMNIGRCITIDYAGDLIIGGQFSDTTDFDPGPGSSILTSNSGMVGIDPFVCKFDTAGNFIWAKSYSGIPENQLLGATGYIVDIVSDIYGNIITTGRISNSSGYDFNPDPNNSYSLSIPTGNELIFYSKLDSLGNFIWAKGIITKGWSSSVSCALDTSGNIYSVGNFTDTVDFDPDSGIQNLVSSTPNLKSSNDTYILKLDSSGNFVWVKQIPKTVDPTGIVSDPVGNLSISGNFHGLIDFNHHSSSTLMSYGGSDIYILRLDSSGKFSWVKQIGGVKNDYSRTIHMDNSNNIYIGGSFMQGVDFDPNQVNNNSTLTTDDILTPEGYIVKFNTLGDFLWVKGLDYVVTSLNTNKANIFAVKPITTSSGIGLSESVSIHKFTQTTCDTTYSTHTEKSCDFYLFNDKLFTESGTYLLTLTNAKGCDSIITLELTIYSLDIDVTITQNEDELIAQNKDSGVTYQWIDCTSKTPIYGATHRNFTVPDNGTYAAVISQKGCSDTSLCYSLPTRVTESINNTRVTFYPNPTTRYLFIKTNTFQDAELAIIDITGRVIKKESLHGNNFKIDLKNVSAGIYILEVSCADSEIYRTRIQKR